MDGSGTIRKNVSKNNNKQPPCFDWRIIRKEYLAVELLIEYGYKHVEKQHTAYGDFFVIYENSA
jgi:hypothetical protein